MKFFLYGIGLMALAMVVRLVGWVLHAWQVVTGSAESVSLWQSIVQGAPRGWQLAWPVLAGSLVLAAAVSVVAVVILAVPLLHALIRRGGTPGVFISYHHGHAETAAALAQALTAAGMRPLMVGFDPQAAHAEVNRRVDELLADCQYLVCLPGAAAQPAYLNNEVLAAAHARKSLLFLVEHPHGHLPDSASPGYPALMKQAVVARQFAPVGTLLRYLQGGWRAVWDLYWMPGEPLPALQRLSGWVASAVMVGVVVVFMATWLGLLGFIALEYFLHPAVKPMVLAAAVASMLSLLAMTLGLLLPIVVAQAVSNVIRRQQVARAARHAIREGRCTAALLRAAFAPAGDGATGPDFIAALWPEPPPHSPKAALVSAA